MVTGLNCGTECPAGGLRLPKSSREWLGEGACRRPYEIFELTVLRTSDIRSGQLSGGFRRHLALVAEKGKRPKVALDWRVVLLFVLAIHAHLIWNILEP